MTFSLYRDIIVMKAGDDMEAEYEKLCLYCEFAAPTYEPDKMLCSKRGIVSCSYKCSKFIYDPLKRIPRIPKKQILDEKTEI